MRRINRNIIYILIIMIIIVFFLGLKIINKKVKPTIFNIAQDECKRLSNIIINNAVKKEIANGLTFDKLFVITYENDKVSSMDFDTIVVNRLLTDISNDILLNLQYIEDGKTEYLDGLVGYDKNKLKKGIIYEIPITTNYNNVFISNLSPKVPVRLHLIGNINSNINTKVTNYGINNALVEVYAYIEIDLQVILPFNSKTIKTSSNIPLAIKMINGNIPQFFSSNSNGSISIPVS